MYAIKSKMQLKAWYIFSYADLYQTITMVRLFAKV